MYSLDQDLNLRSVAYNAKAPLAELPRPPDMRTATVLSNKTLPTVWSWRCPPTPTRCCSVNTLPVELLRLPGMTVRCKSVFFLFCLKVHSAAFPRSATGQFLSKPYLGFCYSQ